jgi:hypothetical protein
MGLNYPAIYAVLVTKTTPSDDARLWEEREVGVTPAGR